MNWETTGVISDIIGAIAVVVSLVHIALQVRQSTIKQLSNLPGFNRCWQPLKPQMAERY